MEAGFLRIGFLVITKIIARPSIQPVARRWPDVEVTIELKK